MSRQKKWRKMMLTGGIVLLFALTGCGERADSEAQEESAAESVAIMKETMEAVVEPTSETQSQAQTTSGSGGEIRETALPEINSVIASTEPESKLPATEAVSSSTEAQNTAPAQAVPEYGDLSQISFDPTWEYADRSKISTGTVVLYRASEESGRKGLIIGVNAGHGTSGGTKVKTLCHPDGSAKVTGGSTAAGATEATAVSGGMTFQDGTPERTVTLRMAQILRDRLLAAGYDVLMLRDGEDVQLDNVARTVMCNNVADCHIALHWDSGDGKDYDKGCFYIAVPEGLKNMEPVASHWQQHDALGADLVEGLRGQGATIYGSGHMSIDLTQTAYSTIPSVDMELGNAYSDHSDATLEKLAAGLLDGINTYFGQ